jgi:carbamoyl-phosphate synthase large subunit
MSSTGEVGCLGDDFGEALLNAMIATGFNIPDKKKGIMVSSGGSKSKVDLLDACIMLQENGYPIYATGGTQQFLKEHGVKAELVHWPDENNDKRAFDLLINIPKNLTKRELTNGYKIRRAAIDHNIPLITNARLAAAFIESFCSIDMNDIQIKSWQEYI